MHKMWVLKMWILYIYIYHMSTQHYITYVGIAIWFLGLPLKLAVLRKFRYTPNPLVNHDISHEQWPFWGGMPAHFQSHPSWILHPLENSLLIWSWRSRLHSMSQIHIPRWSIIPIIDGYHWWILISSIMYMIHAFKSFQIHPWEKFAKPCLK